MLIFLTKNDYCTMVLVSLEQHSVLTEDTGLKLDEANAAEYLADDIETTVY